jgi:hypothetical protein
MALDDPSRLELAQPGCEQVARDPRQRLDQLAEAERLRVGEKQLADGEQCPALPEQVEEPR